METLLGVVENFERQNELKSKIRILESIVHPTVTYGVQTWACTVKQTQKVATTQHAMLKIIKCTKQRDKIHIFEL